MLSDISDKHLDQICFNEENIQIAELENNKFKFFPEKVMKF